MSDHPQQTPILELARGVPKSTLVQWETQWFEDGTPCGHASAPVGVYLHKLADALEAKDREIERLMNMCRHWKIAEATWDKDRVEALETRVAELEGVLRDVDRWLAVFIAAWDKSRDKKKPSEAPIAMMEAIRQHSVVRQALAGERE